MHLERALGLLRDDAGRSFDAPTRSWSPCREEPRGKVTTPEDAARWLQRESGSPCRVPVGVIGPRSASPQQMAIAERLGEGLGHMGAFVLCGGREGVMDAVCRGVTSAGGLSIGLLPDGSPESANRFVSIVLATGIGVARNAIVARASICLVAVGGGHGTTSEIAFGLQFGTPVFGLAGAPDLAGVTRLPDPDDALRAVARVLLNLG